jgi:hypothetical protein
VSNSSVGADFILDEAIARRVLETVDAGLCSGVGEPVPGQMCVMAAINYALGREHGDDPEICVGSAVRAFDIALNDSAWSSNEARAKGMRAEAIAKLGSNKIDQDEFAKRLAIRTVNVMVPIALRAVVAFIPDSTGDLEQVIQRCERANDLREAYNSAECVACAARSAAYAAYNAASSAAWAAYSAAESTARSAACSAASSAAWAASGAAESTARSAAYAAYNAASSAAWAARNAASSAAYDDTLTDETLTLAANLAKDILVEMGSEGAKYLCLLGSDTPASARSDQS